MVLRRVIRQCLRVACKQGQDPDPDPGAARRGVVLMQDGGECSLLGWWAATACG